MKRFIFQIIIFVLIGVMLSYVQAICLLRTEIYQYTVEGKEIYYSIKKSKQKSSSNIVIIGDSVGLQLFSNYTYNEPINSLACNQAISMAGHYCLLQNYFKSGNHADKVYLIVTPFSFQNNLNQIFTYHYFLKPFYREEYDAYFSNLVYDQILKIPFYKFSTFPVILTSNWAPDFKSNDKPNYRFLSPISIEYLNKIKRLSERNGFDFIILPTPTKLSNKNEIDKMDPTEISTNGFNDEFKNFFENIIYVDDRDFQDNVHLKNPNKYTEIYKKNLLQ